MSKLLFIGVLLFSLQPQHRHKPQPLRILTTTLPDGQVGVPYSFTLQATGGTPPYHWNITSLPPGLSLSGDNIMGTPLVAGKYPMLEVRP